MFTSVLVLINPKFKNKNKEYLTDAFVSGASYSFGAVLGLGPVGVSYNFVKPMVDKTSEVYGAHASEYVIGSPGLNVDLAATLNILSIGKQEK